MVVALVLVGGAAAGLIAANGTSSSVGTASHAGGSPETASTSGESDGAPPSLAQVRAALQSTGVTLCDLSQPGNMTEHVFAQTTTGACTDAGRGLVRIFTESDTASAKTDVQFSQGQGDATWIAGTVVVDTRSLLREPESPWRRSASRGSPVKAPRCRPRS
jgi:hypothetical protein